MSQDAAVNTEKRRPWLDIRDFSVIHGAGPDGPRIVEDVTLAVAPGEILGLVGESGSGKSITCLAAMGLLGAGWRTEGGIRLGDSQVGDATRESEWTRLRGRTAAMVFQDSTSSLNPIQTIGKQLADTVARLRRVSRSEARRIAIELLHRVEIPQPEEKFHAYPFQLSGGQNQRVMIAVALAGEPELLFADEPTTALDVTIQSQILDLIKSLRDESGMGVVFVTHDLGVVSEVCDRVAVLYAGRIVETGNVAEIMAAPRHPYTKGLIDSMPSLKGRIPDGIAGQVPAPGNRPAGCVFAPRCFKAAESCGMARPDDVMIGPDHAVGCFFPLTDDELRSGAAQVKAPPGLSAAADGGALLALKEAACDYKTRKGPFRAVSGVTLALHEGDNLAVIGESGSGKSTVGRLMLGIEPTSAGEALFEGKPVPMLGTREYKAFARCVQLVPQNPYLSLDPRATIGNQIEEPLVIHGIGTPEERQRQRNHLIEAVGLAAAHAERYPHEISGGQCQRAVIARALSLEPKLLICDEATASLDVSVQARIIELLIDLQARFHLSIVFITHDLRLVRSLCNQVAVMRSGELVEVNETEAIFQQASHPYTRELLASIPDVASTPASNEESP